MLGKVGEGLAVQLDVLCFERADQLAVGESERTCTGIDFDGPELAEVTLLGSAIAEGVGTGFESSGSCKTDLAFTAPLHSLCLEKEVAAALYMLCSSGYAWHIAISRDQRKAYLP